MENSSDNFYNNFSFLYPVINWFLKSQTNRLLKEVNARPFGNLLEIGVGNGQHLKKYKTHNITAIDTSSKMLKLAKKNNRSNIDLLKMNGKLLMFKDQTFDYVVLSHVIAVVDEPEKVMQEVHRVLKPKGKVFVLNHFTPDNGLKYFDKGIQLFSKLLHFKSILPKNDLFETDNFKILEEIPFVPFSYFKLIILGKK